MSDNQDERVESDQPHGEWYAAKTGDCWTIYDCDGTNLLVLWERPTPKHVGDMEVAYQVGVRHGVVRGEIAAQAKVRSALGI